MKNTFCITSVLTETVCGHLTTSDILEPNFIKKTVANIF